jgi:hypothetical protein
VAIVLDAGHDDSLKSNEATGAHGDFAPSHIAVIPRCYGGGPSAEKLPFRTANFLTRQGAKFV